MWTEGGEITLSISNWQPICQKKKKKKSSYLPMPYFLKYCWRVKNVTHTPIILANALVF